CATGPVTAIAQQTATTQNYTPTLHDALPIYTTAPTVSLSSPSNGSSTNDTTPTFSGNGSTATGDSSTITVNIYAGSDTNGTLVQTRTATVCTPVTSVDRTPLCDGTYTAQALQ